MSQSEILMNDDETGGFIRTPVNESTLQNMHEMITRTANVVNPEMFVNFDHIAEVSFAEGASTSVRWSDAFTWLNQVLSPSDVPAMLEKFNTLMGAREPHAISWDDALVTWLFYMVGGGGSITSHVNTPHLIGRAKRAIEAFVTRIEDGDSDYALFDSSTTSLPAGIEPPRNVTRTAVAIELITQIDHAELTQMTFVVEDRMRTALRSALNECRQTMGDSSSWSFGSVIIAASNTVLKDAHAYAERRRTSAGQVGEKRTRSNVISTPETVTYELDIRVDLSSKFIAVDKHLKSMRAGVAGDVVGTFDLQTWREMALQIIDNRTNKWKAVQNITAGDKLGTGFDSYLEKWTDAYLLDGKPPLDPRSVALKDWVRVGWESLMQTIRGIQLTRKPGGKRALPRNADGLTVDGVDHMRRVQWGVMQCVNAWALQRKNTTELTVRTQGEHPTPARRLAWYYSLAVVDPFNAVQFWDTGVPAVPTSPVDDGEPLTPQHFLGLIDEFYMMFVDAITTNMPVGRDDDEAEESYDFEDDDGSVPSTNATTETLLSSCSD